MEKSCETAGLRLEARTSVAVAGEGNCSGRDFLSLQLGGSRQGIILPSPLQFLHRQYHSYFLDMLWDWGWDWKRELLRQRFFCKAS